jgi:hypothetical protein
LRQPEDDTKTGLKGEYGNEDERQADSAPVAAMKMSGAGKAVVTRRALAGEPEARSPAVRKQQRAR